MSTGHRAQGSGHKVQNLPVPEWTERSDVCLPALAGIGGPGRNKESALPENLFSREKYKNRLPAIL